jgi:hypothetical protein
VRLLHRDRLPVAPQRKLAVSLPPSCGKLFDAIGLAEPISRAPFIRSTGNTVWWGGAPTRVEPFASGQRGWQLDVVVLAALIRRQARAAGAVVDENLPLQPPPGLLIDCGGRFGAIARSKGVRRDVSTHRTIALVGEWHRSDAWPVPDDSHTLIESYEGGWVWSVPLAAGVRHIAAMVDPQRSQLEHDGSSKAVYLAEIDKTREFKRLITSATLVGGPWGWDATQYDSTEYARDNWMLAGDAGSFVDPLSSAGVKKALASGWLAAIVANTCLRTPSMKEHAFAFFNDREREIARHLHRESARFLSDASAGHPTPFWDERSASDGETLIDQDDVRGVFDRLKASDDLRLGIGRQVSIAPRPIIRGNEIVMEPHIVTTTAPGAVRYVNGIDMVSLVELAPGCRQVPDLFAAYEKQAGPTALPDFLQALAIAVARRWLVAE